MKVYKRAGHVQQLPITSSHGFAAHIPVAIKRCKYSGKQFLATKAFKEAKRFKILAPSTSSGLIILNKIALTQFKG